MLFFHEWMVDYIFLTDFSVLNPNTNGLRNIMKTFEIIHGYIYTFKEM